MTQVDASLIVIGGSSSQWSFEKIDLNTGNKWQKVMLPFSIKGHCSVKIDDQIIMIVGGVLNGKVIQHFVNFDNHNHGMKFIISY